MELLALLPADFSAAIFVVIHSSPDSPGMLPRILAQASTLEAEYARDGASIVGGHVYVAPADHHLLLEPGRIRVTHGPKENRFRPAIDPLFRSAAYAYGPKVIGIILSGSLDDGTSGLWAIKDRGGLAVVQEPDEAAYPSMPLHALKYVHVDYRLTIAAMGKLLPHLVGETLAASTGAPVTSPVETREGHSLSTNSSTPGARERIEIETKIALENNPLEAGVMQLGPLTPFTCPECSGVLVQLQEGNLLRFRCHTGHAYSMDSLLASINDSIEKTLWSTVRALEEHMLLLRHLARHVKEHAGEDAGEQLDEHAEAELARRFAFKAQTAEDKVQIVRQLAFRQSSEEGV
jgi:two-component system, chemotaxis family, protein-glutamate methylesterase/glutaminase